MPFLFHWSHDLIANSSSLAHQTTAITLDTPKNIQPPEALTGGKIGLNSDIWTLGCTVSLILIFPPFSSFFRNPRSSIIPWSTRHTSSSPESPSLMNHMSHHPLKSQKKGLANSKVSSLKVVTSQRRISPRLQNSSGGVLLSRLRIGRRRLRCWKVVGLIWACVLVGGAVTNLLVSNVRTPSRWKKGFRL